MSRIEWVSEHGINHDFKFKPSFCLIDPDANLPTVLILVSGAAIKVGIGIICYRHGTPNAKILALDQRNDIITSMVALGGAWIGDNYWLYADPVGAILVCTFIAGSWFSNAFENIPLIVGKRWDGVVSGQITSHMDV